MWTPLSLFLAMMAIVTCQVGADHVYWAYIPNPPLFQAVSWGDPEVLVYINETQWMPGLFDPLLTAHPNEEGKPAEGNNNSCSFPLGAEGIPLCIGKGSHCLQYVRFPFLLLKGSVNWHPENGSLNCTVECQLFTCINASLTLNSSSQSLYCFAHGQNSGSS